MTTGISGSGRSVGRAGRTGGQELRVGGESSAQKMSKAGGQGLPIGSGVSLAARVMKKPEKPFSRKVVASQLQKKMRISAEEAEKLALGHMKIVDKMVRRLVRVLKGRREMQKELYDKLLRLLPNQLMRNMFISKMLEAKMAGIIIDAADWNEIVKGLQESGDYLDGVELEDLEAAVSDESEEGVEAAFKEVMEAEGASAEDLAVADDGEEEMVIQQKQPFNEGELPRDPQELLDLLPDLNRFWLDRFVQFLKQDKVPLAPEEYINKAELKNWCGEAPCHRYAALCYARSMLLRESGYEGHVEALDKAIELYGKTERKKIQGGLNVTIEAMATARAGLGSTASNRDTHLAVVDSKNAREMYNILMKTYKDRFVEGLAFTQRSLAADLGVNQPHRGDKPWQSSVDPVLLQSRLNDMDLVTKLGNMHRNMRLIVSHLDDYFGAKSRLTPTGLMEKTFSLIDNQFPYREHVEEVVSDAGLGRI